MLPTLQKDGELTDLKTLQDSIQLGNLMIRYRLIIPLEKDPRLISSGNEKIPKYVVPAKTMFSDKGIYMVLEKE